GPSMCLLGQSTKSLQKPKPEQSKAGSTSATNSFPTPSATEPLTSKIQDKIGRDHHLQSFQLKILKLRRHGLSRWEDGTYFPLVPSPTAGTRFIRRSKICLRFWDRGLGCTRKMGMGGLGDMPKFRRDLRHLGVILEAERRIASD
ncbi:hypothetical protein HK102_005465, partial [Quaeritorhiza haematococci]